MKSLQHLCTTQAAESVCRSGRCSRMNLPGWWWLDSIQSFRSDLPKRLPADLLCQDAHTLPVFIAICPCCWYLTLSPPPHPPPPLSPPQWGLLLHDLFNVHSSLQKRIAERWYVWGLQRAAIYSQSVHNQEVPWQITPKQQWLLHIHPNQPRSLDEAVTFIFAFIYTTACYVLSEAIVCYRREHNSIQEGHWENNNVAYVSMCSHSWEICGWHFQTCFHMFLFNNLLANF